MDEIEAFEEFLIRNEKDAPIEFEELFFDNLEELFA